jgi:hypothetical protein
MLETNEGLLMTTCVLRPTPVCVQRMHVPVPEQDIQDKVGAVRPYLRGVHATSIIFCHANTKAKNIPPTNISYFTAIYLQI